MTEAWLGWFKKQWCFGLLFAVVIFCTTTWQLGASPATWFDEGINIGIANSLVERGIYSLAVSPEEVVSATERPFLITSNYPILVPVAAALILFNSDSLIVVRLPMVLYLWAFFGLVFLLIKRFHPNSWAPWLGIGLLVTFAPLYGNGKAVLGEVPGLVWLLAGLLVLPAKINWRLVLAGFCFGLAIACKPYFLIIAPAVLVGEWYAFRTDKKIFFTRLGYLFIGGIGPIMVWLFTILIPFSLDSIQRTIGYYSNSYAASNFTTVVTSNVWRFFSESTPIHLLGLVLVLGFWLKDRFKNKTLTELEIILAMFVGITMLWYLKTPGWYRYFFTAHVVLLAFLPVSLLWFKKQKIAIALMLGLISIQGVHLLTRTNDALYYSTEATDFSKEVLSAVTAEEKILVINSPSVAFLLSDHAETYQFLQINPSLHFGQADLKIKASTWYPYVITSGSLEGIDIESADAVLKSEYQSIKQVGHYQLWKKQ